MLEARIDSSDGEDLVVTTSEGKVETIHRADVVDIDHPGKVRLTTGAAMVVGGATMLTYGLVHQACGAGSDTCDYSGNVVATVFSIPILVAGVILATSGGLVYYDSVIAAQPPPGIPSTQAVRHELPRLACSFCPH